MTSIQQLQQSLKSFYQLRKQTASAHNTNGQFTRIWDATLKTVDNLYSEISRKGFNLLKSDLHLISVMFNDGKTMQDYIMHELSLFRTNPLVKGFNSKAKWLRAGAKIQSKDVLYRMDDCIVRQATRKDLTKILNNLIFDTKNRVKPLKQLYFDKAGHPQFKF